MSQAWITVGSPENFEVLRKRKFDVTAFKSSRQKQSSEMQPGDRIVFYLTGEVAFGGVVEVTGEAFEDHSDIGLESEGKPDEDFPYRIKTKPVVIAKQGKAIDVREITDLLDKTRKFGPKKLGMCFRGNLHKISDADLEVIEGLLAERK
ncbi:MAG: EVE domain-containing protein [Dehalococcoidia bacterium]|nr:EVE domain-containing protein [Dehalococcoidia bacterium]MCA9856055.1 EVE domain-containing protein [Dehalococcoidia bacterium]